MTQEPYPIPETGGSWSRDPKTGALTLIEEPTGYPAPEAPPEAAPEADPAAAAAEAAPVSRKSPAKAEPEKDS